MNLLLLAFVVFAQVSTEYSRELGQALEDAGNNRVALDSAIAEAPHDHKEDVIWLIIKMDHLDRLEMKKEILLDNVKYAHLAYQAWGLPDSFFREYVLPYRFHEEAILPWRKEFYAFFGRYRSKQILKTALKINRDVAAKFDMRDKKDLFGPEPSPLHLVRSRSGTNDQAGVLLAAALRSVGIPTRFVRCAVLGSEKGGLSWVEFYDGANWEPAYPFHPEALGDFRFVEKDRPDNLTVVLARSARRNEIVTPSYSAWGTLKLNFIRKGVIVDNFEHFCIAKLNDGAFLPIDDLIEYSDDADSLILGDGEYLLEAGVRTKRGDVRFQIIPVHIDSGTVVTKTVNLDIPVNERGQEELLIRKLDSIPRLVLKDSDGKNLKLADLVAKRAVLLYIFDWQTEPPKRMLSQIVSLADKNELQVYAVFIDTLARFDHSLAPKLEMLSAEPGRLKAGLRIESMPSTLLFNNGKLVYWDEGYNLNIEAELEQVLERD